MYISRKSGLSGAALAGIAMALVDPACAGLSEAPRVGQGIGRTITNRSDSSWSVLCSINEARCPESEPAENSEAALRGLKPGDPAPPPKWDFEFVITPEFARDRESDAWGSVFGISAKKGESNIRSFGADLEYLRVNVDEGDVKTDELAASVAAGYEWANGWALTANAAYGFSPDSSDREFESGVVGEYTKDFGGTRSLTFGLAASWVRGASAGEAAKSDLRTAAALAFSFNGWELSADYAPRDDVSEEDDWSAGVETPFGFSVTYGKGSVIAVALSLNFGDSK